MADAEGEKFAPGAGYGRQQQTWRGAWASSFACLSASAICKSSLIAPRQKSVSRIASSVSRFSATLPPQTIVSGSVPRGSDAERRSTRSRRVRHERERGVDPHAGDQIRPRDRRSRRHRRPGGARQVAAPRQNPRGVLRHRQTDPLDRQARRAGRHAHHDERVRAPRGASGLPDAPQRGVPEFRSRQPAALGEVSRSGAVGRRGAPVFHQWRARTGGPIFPLAREPDVARVLDLSGDGRHDPFQCVERLQPIQTLAHRRQPGNAGGPAQGAHRSRLHARTRQNALAERARARDAVRPALHPPRRASPTTPRRMQLRSRSAR